MRILILASAAALALAGPAHAKKPDHHAHGADAPGAVSAEAVRVAFSHLERQLIVEYFESHNDQGGRGLPPGIAKKVARGGALPPGIAKKVLPRELESRLPNPPSGYERVVVDGRVVLVEIASQVIHDVLMDIIVAR